MLETPRNAEFIDSHRTSPHCSIDRSLSALGCCPSRYILVKSPYILTVWIPGVPYAWVWSPVTLAETVPSPQSTVYLPVASPTGIVMLLPAPAVSQVVTKWVRAGGAVETLRGSEGPDSPYSLMAATPKT